MTTDDFPRELAVDKSNHKLFDDLASEDMSPFSKRDAPMKDVFLCAMSIGYYNKLRKNLKSRRGSIPSRTLNDEEKWLIRSIGISEKKDLEALFDIKEIVTIAEEYANGGIQLLYDLTLGGQPGDAYKRLEASARETLVEPKSE